MPFVICTRAGLFACLFIFVVWTSTTYAKANSSNGDEMQQLATIVNLSLESNPEIQAAQAAVDAAQARLTGAGLPLNNPELEFGAERTDISIYTIGISQTIDWHDKQGGFEQVARAELAAAKARVEAIRLTKTNELLDAIGSVAVRHEITSLAKRQTEILDRFVRLAERRHSAGDISQAELELARLSLTEAVMQHAGNGADLVGAKSEYFSLSGQMPNSLVTFRDLIPLTLPEKQEEETLAQNHPQVQAALKKAQSARQQIETADRERRADPTFGLTTGRDDTESLVALSISIPLQVRNDFRSNVDAAQAEALEAEQEAHQVYRNLQARLNSARSRFKLVADAWGLWVTQGRISLQQHIELLETLLQAGEISTADYLLQVKQTLGTQIASIELHGNLWNAWIEWLSASGTLNSWLNRSSMEQ
jgi:cobalt-zinc-cadmium efflux system outer membrane protein